jgi:hypothetical protein
MVFVEGEDYRQLRRPGDDPAQFRSPVRLEGLSRPDSLEHQYLAENFSQSGWPDTEGTANMTVSGLTAGAQGGTDTVVSDGVDDFGLSDGPQDIAQTTQFTIAFAFQSSDLTDNTAFLAVDDGSNGRMFCFDFDNQDGSLGELAFFVEASGNRLTVETTGVIVDGSAHLVVIRKLKDSGSNPVEIYVDDMSTPVPTVKQADQGFSSSDYAPTIDMGFFCRNKGTQSFHKAFSAGRFEFYSDALSAQQRKNLKARADLV